MKNKPRKPAMRKEKRHLLKFSFMHAWEVLVIGNPRRSWRPGPRTVQQLCKNPWTVGYSQNLEEETSFHHLMLEAITKAIAHRRPAKKLLNCDKRSTSITPTCLRCGTVLRLCPCTCRLPNRPWPGPGRNQRKTDQSTLLSTYTFWNLFLWIRFLFVLFRL